MTAELPPGWTTRPPTLVDVADILAVVHASDIAAVGEPDFTSDEVLDILSGPGHDLRLDSRLALDPAGRIMAWGYLENPSRSSREQVEVYVHPDGGQPAQAHLLGVLLDRVPVRARANGHREVTVRAGVIASETDYVALLVAAGFTFVKRYARMSRPLTGTEAMPELPPGVVIRPVRADDDADMRAFFTILKRAFADIPDSISGHYDDFRANIAAAASTSFDEWFVAEVDGERAGVLRSSDQGREAGEGWVRSLAVAAEFRGRGLGAVLLKTAFATYAAKGRTAVGLGVDLTNPTGAYPLYESVGLRVRYEADIYERSVLVEPDPVAAH